MKKPRNAVDRLAVAVERAEMPSVLYPADLVRHFPNLPDERHAERAIRSGLFGPWFTIEDRPALLRDDLKEHLRRRASHGSHELVPLERTHSGSPLSVEEARARMKEKEDQSDE